MPCVELPLVDDLSALTGAFFRYVLLDINPMTIVSSTGKASPSYPPVDDAINFLKGINWSEIGSRVRVGTSNLLVFAMKFSEKSYDFHEYLHNRLNDMKWHLAP